ncbi:hypothetical protein [Paramuribaculum intestinale]|uniref:hypothetical protein n=1 Tax=Paramuribaculum intestinale TaxID=2094151 RepID=UPI0025A97779|nr:hypothetical protein [Paramuribaculum intestinale]
MKIQINSKEAHERLIGDDKEMEIAIKNAVINQFAKQYLKSVANDGILQELKAAVLAEVEAEVARHVERIPAYGMSRFKARPELKEAVQDTTKEALRELVKEAIEERMSDVEGEIKQLLGYKLDIICDKVSERNIDRLVQSKLRKLIEE